MPTLIAATKSLIGAAVKVPGIDQALQSQAERYECSGDRSGSRAAIGLDHVAIDPDGALAQALQISHRAQRASDEALNFLRAPALLSLGRFARGAGQRRARQHSVLAGNPSLARIAQECGTVSSTDAVQMTRVLPISISAEPSAVEMKSG
jgi:hypothetical protein